MIQYELSLLNKGINYIAGVDEVGRGPLAGPLVVCAVVLNIEKIVNIYDEGNKRGQINATNFYSFINDSKKVTQKRREKISEFLVDESICYSISEIANSEIDDIGITQATQKAFYNAVINLTVTPQHVLTDAFEIKNLTKHHQTNINRGDQLSISIASASIIAKVYRDEIMTKLHNESEKYNVYGFDKHKGYGTKQHLDAIKKYGFCDVHRKSFEPIKSMISK